MDVQRTLTVKTDEEWMRTRTQKATLMLEEMDFIKTMGNAFKEACMPAELTYTVVIGDCSKLELEEIDVRLRADRFDNAWLSCCKTCEPRIMASVRHFAPYCLFA